MLTGQELGRAIDAAIKMKRITKAALARRFGIKPPSIQDWVNRGTIEKDKLEALWLYFSDVCGPDHWGLREFPFRTDTVITTFAREPVDARLRPLMSLAAGLSDAALQQLVDFALFVSERDVKVSKSKPGRLIVLTDFLKGARLREFQ